MADFAGALAGIQAFHQDQDVQAQTQERFAQIQHLGAMTDETKMQTQVAGAKLQREQQMLQIIAQGPQKAGVDADGNPLTPGDRMSDLGTRLLEGGFVNEGRNLIYQADQMKGREAQQRTAALRAKTELGNQRMKQFESLNNFLGSVNPDDPSSFDAAKMVWIQENPDTPLPSYLQTYNPQVIDLMKKYAKSGQEQERRRQAEEREEGRDDRAEKSLAERRRNHEETQRHQQTLERIAQARLDQVKKTGGRKAPQVGSPKNSDVLAAQAMIRRDYPDIAPDMSVGTGKDSPMVSSAAYDMANEAKALMTKNPGLSMPEAMTQVYGRMKEKGDFRLMQKKPTILQKLTGQDPGKEAEYKPAASEPALPYVKGVTKPEKDKIYDPGTGKKYRFDGKNMVEVE